MFLRLREEVLSELTLSGWAASAFSHLAGP